MRNLILSSLALPALIACATPAIAPERLASNEAAIRSADEVGAGKLPLAALHLRLAEEAMVKAKELQAKGDEEGAELFLLRSAADADLALALTRKDEAKADAEKANAAVLTIQGKTS